MNLLLCFVFIFFCFFFFFKQKTAYEMRISDWSSDVCSSDLGGDMDHITLPARSGLDAEQVVTGGAVGTHDLTLAPTRFQRRLTQDQLFRNAALIRSHASGVGHLRNKVLYMLGIGRAHV